MLSTGPAEHHEENSISEEASQIEAVRYAFWVNFTCEGCVETIRERLLNKDLALKVEGDVVNKIITVFAKRDIRSSQIEKKIIGLGFNDPVPVLLEQSVGLFLATDQQQPKIEKRKPLVQAPGDETNELLHQFQILTLKTDRCLDTVTKALRNAGAQAVEIDPSAKTAIIKTRRNVETQVLAQAIQATGHTPQLMQQPEVIQRQPLIFSSIALVDPTLGTQLDEAGEKERKQKKGRFGKK